MSQAATDPFELLGQPRRFDLDESRLRSAHRALVTQLHPDREPDAVRREEAVRRSAAVNEALRTLLDPVRRAEVLLGEGAGAPAVAMAPEFLGAMLELRERIADAQAARDPAAIESLLREVEGERDGVLAMAGAAFARGDHAAAREAIARLRYLRRMVEQGRTGLDGRA